VNLSRRGFKSSEGAQSRDSNYQKYLANQARSGACEREASLWYCVQRDAGRGHGMMGAAGTRGGGMESWVGVDCQTCGMPARLLSIVSPADFTCDVY
jgi:hypothetical protein